MRPAITSIIGARANQLIRNSSRNLCVKNSTCWVLLFPAAFTPRRLKIEWLDWSHSLITFFIAIIVSFLIIIQASYWIRNWFELNYLETQLEKLCVWTISKNEWLNWLLYSLSFFFLNSKSWKKNVDSLSFYWLFTLEKNKRNFYTLMLQYIWFQHFSWNDECLIFEFSSLFKDLFSVLIEGPAKTPYEGGLFIFDFQLPNDYPHNPPTCHYW